MKTYISTILGIFTVIGALVFAYDRGKYDAGAEFKSKIENTKNKAYEKHNSLVESIKNKNIRLELELRNTKEKLVLLTADTKQPIVKPIIQNTEYSTISESSDLKSNNPFSIYKKWKGSYTCTQGKTSLIFKIISTDNNANMTELGLAYNVKATFDFDYKNRTMSGTYYLNGKYYPETNVAIFEPGQWIRNPANYGSVGMDGILSSSGTVYSGKIPASGCGNFYLAASKI